MEKLYKSIAQKMEVEEENVEMCISEAMQYDANILDDDVHESRVDKVVRDIIRLFYCISLEEHLKKAK